MRKLFKHTVRTAVAMKLVDLAIQAVDGTKVVANASLNRSYDAEGLRGLLVRVERAIGDLEAQELEKTLLLPICLRSWPTRRS